ncbi:MAG: lamin tail domain-containing protein [Ignavibacteria bacterium]|nr:lamin tail domain-containing protein [Ignavibacteria bacterium]
MRLQVSLLFSLFLLSYCLNSQIVINEIYPAPLTNEVEWVEIYNPTDSDYELTNFFIQNRTNTSFFPYFLNIPSKSFAILTSDTSKLINSPCLKIQLKLPTLHNDWGILVLRKSDSTVIDSIYYNFSWGKKGYSLERIDWDAPAVDKSNWIASSDTSGNTICKENSKVAPQTLLSSSFNIDNGQLKVVLKNNGKRPIEKIELTAKISYYYKNALFFKNIESKYINTIFSKDSITLSYGILDNFKEIDFEILDTLFFSISYEAELIRKNELHTFHLNIPHPFKGLLINEFLYDSHTGCGEFIEFVNLTNYSFDLKEWRIENNTGKQRAVRFNGETKNYLIPPKSYFVVFWDSTFYNCFENLRGRDLFFFIPSSISLRNSGDVIKLFNKIGSLQDSLTYSPQWHRGRIKNTKQRSLEKAIENKESYIEENWFTCVADSGATPGSINSVSIEQSERIYIQAEPTTFSPRSNFKSSSKIQYRLPFRQANITVKIYDINGTLIRDLVNNGISASVGEIEWNGKDNSGVEVQAGGYIILIEAVDLITGNTVVGKQIIGVGW